MFLGVYLLLSVLYAFYLKISYAGEYYPDFITHLVALQSNDILSGMGYKSVVEPNLVSPSMTLTLEDNYSVGIIEGCNAVSIVILFTAFIIAFAEKFKKTFLFLLAGAVLIYAVNVFRIVLLVIALYKYPQYEDVLHSVVFPGIIYGMVFILWMIWVRMLNPKHTNV